eukprot:scaffold4278_cov173-Amphora_coffeaeformis.AAC.7
MSSSDRNTHINGTNAEAEDTSSVGVGGLDAMLNVQKFVGESFGFREEDNSQLSIISSGDHRGPGYPGIVAPLVWCVLLLAVVWYSYKRRRQDTMILPVTVTKTDNTEKPSTRASAKEYSRVAASDTSGQKACDDEDTVIEDFVMLKSRSANGLERFNGSLGVL